MIASGLVFEVGVVSTDSDVMVTAFVLSAGLLGMCEAAFWTAIVELGMPRGGLAAGLMNMGGNAGGLLSPVVTPLLSAQFRRPLRQVGRLAGEPGCGGGRLRAGCVPVVRRQIACGFEITIRRFRRFHRFETLKSTDPPSLLSW